MKRKGEDEKFFLCPSKSIVEPRYLKHSAILVAEKKKKRKEESEEQNACIQYNGTKSKEFIIQETLLLPQMLLQD